LTGSKVGQQVNSAVTIDLKLRQASPHVGAPTLLPGLEGFAGVDVLFVISRF
jgi:hypothetical protein